MVIVYTAVCQGHGLYKVRGVFRTGDGISSRSPFFMSVFFHPGTALYKYVWQECVRETGALFNSVVSQEVCFSLFNFRIYLKCPECPCFSTLLADYSWQSFSTMCQRRNTFSLRLSELFVSSPQRLTVTDCVFNTDGGILWNRCEKAVSSK